MKLKEKKILINILFFNVFLIMFFFAKHYLGYNDFIQLFKWYILLLLSSWIGYPITSVIFKKFNDRGYIFSKVLGFLIPSIIVFFLCNFKLIKFSITNCTIVFILNLIISVIYMTYKYINSKNDEDNNTKNTVLNAIEKIYHIEVIFFVLIVQISYIKGFSPSASDIEKFMDYGFMNSIANSDYLPAKDMWLSGYSINYYYYGHYIATFLSKVAHVSVDYGYNFMLITLFSITCFASYSIINNLFRFYFNSKKVKGKITKVFPVVGGILASLSNTVAGNGHFLIYKYIVPFINKITNRTSSYVYGFPDSTRYIGDNPSTPDKTIHEFPSYSFLVGDLHAHLSDIIFVLTTIAILLSYTIYIRNKNTKKRKGFNFVDSFNIYTIILGILIGTMKMINYWDFPIYLVVSLIIFLITNILTYHKFRDAFWCTFMQILIIITIANVVSIPFTLKFIKISSKIKLAPYHTKLYQFLVLWGLPLLTIILFLTSNIIKYIKLQREKKKNNTNNHIKWYQKIYRAIYNYVYKLKDADLFIIIIAFCAVGLLLIPEIIYVVDIYDTAPRANTMFKLTYNSYIMFSLCMSYMLLNLITDKNKLFKINGWICLVIFILTFAYIIDPVKNWFGDIFNPEGYESLNATDFLNYYYIANYMDEEMLQYIDYDVDMQDDLAIINWLKENANNDDVILEFYGDDFTFDNRISTFTAMSTPMGWVCHEWLWRSVNSSIDFPEFLQERIDDIDYLYTSGDIPYNKYLIEKYDIKYIIVGYNERLHISRENLEIPNENELKSLGDIVFETNINDLKFPSYIIKVNRD